MQKIIFVLLNLIVLIHSLNLCGDWTQYKDIKCVKVLSKKASEEEAIKRCRELDDSSSLITIHDQEEQDFLNLMLKKYSHSSISAWIGMKYNGQEYDWTDGTDSNYTNWSEYAIKDGIEPCVQMSLVTGILGEWMDQSCRKPALVVCQKRQELSLNLLKNIIENLTAIIEKQQEFNEIQNMKIEALESRSIDGDIPLGFLYTQLPNQSSPQQLWPNVKWTEVTQQYSGLFFRAEGSGSEPFGKIQQANQTWISKGAGRCHWNNESAANKSNYSVGEYFFFDMPKNNYNGIKCVNNFAGLYSFSLFTTLGEVRPKNTAIKMWKRIE